MAEASKPITLYLTGDRAGKTIALGSKLTPYIFKNGKIQVLSTETGKINILRKYYACSTKAPVKASA